MLIVETIAKIRRLHFTEGKGIKTICRDLKLSKKVVRKVIRTGITEFTYTRTVQPRPKLGAWLGERFQTGSECRRTPGYCMPFRHFLASVAETNFSLFVMSARFSTM